MTTGIFEQERVKAYQPRVELFLRNGESSRFAADATNQIGSNYRAQGNDAAARGQAAALGYQQQGQQGMQQAQSAAATQRAEGQARQTFADNTGAGYARQASNVQERAAPVASSADYQRASDDAARSRATQYAALGGVQQQTTQAANTGDLQAFRQAPAGPSAAEAQLNMGAQRSVANALSLARSGRAGANPAAERQALFQAGQTISDTNQQAALLRAQEEATRRGQSLQALTVEQQAQQAARGQNLQALSLEQQAIANQRAQDLQAQGLTAEQARAQAAVELQSRAQNDAAALGYSNLAAQQQARGDQIGLGYDTLAQQTIGQGQQYSLGAGSLANQATQIGTAGALGYGQLGAGYANLSNQISEADRQALMQYEALRGGYYMGAQQTNAQTDAQRDAATLGLFTGVVGGLGFGFSDRDVKEDIRPANNVARALGMAAGRGAYEAGKGNGVRMRTGQARHLERANPYRADLELPPGEEDPEDPYGLNYRGLEDTWGGPEYVASDKRIKHDLRPARAYSYVYRDPDRYGEGRFTGPMAQDLERSPATRGAVFEDARGVKRVDQGRLTMVNTSAIGEQQRRIDELEQTVAALGGGRGTSRRDRKAV
jgi:hypothetical protein